MKTCFKCKTPKPLSAFYRHNKMADGRLGKCKDCTKKDSRKTRRSNLEYYRAYDRIRATLPHRAKANVENTKRIRKEVTGYMAAHNAVCNALKKGTLTRQPCQMCGTKEWVHAHHDDYKKPLAVMWLCPVHHKARHAYLDTLSLNTL